EPSFTQPQIYRAVEHQRSVRDGYLEHLLELEGITRDEADRIASQRYEKLEQAFKQAHEERYRPAPQTLSGIWSGYVGGKEPEDEPKTAVPKTVLSDMLVKLTQTPPGFHLHKKLLRGFEQRLAMAKGERPLDWAAAEALAFGTLALDGHRVRLSGQ